MSVTLTGSWVLASAIGSCGARHPAPFAAWVAETRSFHTAFADGSADETVQIDVDREVFALDTHEQRVFWDGTSLHVTPKRGGGRALPAAEAARVRAAWDEWRAGFVHTRVEEVAAPASLEVSADARVYRLGPPFTWDEGYHVYVVTDATGSDGTVFLMHEGGWIRWRLRLGREWPEYDVALDPETYAPAPPSRRPSAWHHERSVGLAASEPPLRLRAECGRGPAGDERGGHVRYTLRDAPDLAVTLDHLARCPTTRIRRDAYTALLPPGAEGCVTSVLRVTEPGVGGLAWQTVRECHTGEDGDLAGGLSIGPSTGLEVELVHAASLQCGEGDGWSSITGPRWVRLEWPGCVPEGPAPARNLHDHRERPATVRYVHEIVREREPGCTLSL